MIVIVDTGIANRHSVRNALEYIGCEAKVSAEAQDIRDATKLVFPGVGAFGAGMESLAGRGLIEILNREVVENGKPTLGICLGMQLVADESDEGGLFRGLGWIEGRVERLQPEDKELKVPHIGFNTVHFREDTALFDGLGPAADFYFVHSYHMVCDAENVIGTVEYGGPVTAAIQKGNLVAVQFHPEKSQSAGLKVLRNFVEKVGD